VAQQLLLIPERNYANGKMWKNYFWKSFQIIADDLIKNKSPLICLFTVK